MTFGMKTSTIGVLRGRAKRRRTNEEVQEGKEDKEEDEKEETERHL